MQFLCIHFLLILLDLKWKQRTMRIRISDRIRNAIHRTRHCVSFYGHEGHGSQENQQFAVKTLVVYLTTFSLKSYINSDVKTCANMYNTT